jgi:cellulose synthase/poly-beta-1,6-N-acetylglucosamine synthase-like glycosyltransferase
MSATSGVQAAWAEVDDRVRSLLGSVEDYAAAVRPDDRLLVPSVSATARQVLPGDLCWLLRMMPVALGGETGLKVLVDSSDDVEFLVKVLQRHPQTAAAPRLDFVVVSSQELDTAITMFHGPPKLARARIRPALEEDWEEVDAELVPSAAVELAGPPATDADVVSIPAEPAQPTLAPELEPLGARLVERGIISAAELSEALALQVRWGGRLGEVLINELGVNEAAVAGTLADQLGLPLVDLGQLQPSVHALQDIDEPLMAAHRLIPIERSEDELTVAMVDPLDEDAIANVHAATGLRVRRTVATQASYDRCFQRLFQTQHLQRATNALLEARPEESALRTLTRGQKVAGALIALAGAVALIVSPVTAFVAFNVIAVSFYLAFSGYRLKLIYNSLARDSEFEVTHQDLTRLDERRLPVITLLVPLYREANVIEQLVAGLQRLDYPKTKLDIKLICEADDPETIAAIEQLPLAACFSLVVVPDAQPKTKPKACNYALMQARGELVVIFDAEDRPDPDQLKRVVLAFAESDEHVVCVQCKLSYFNRDQNLLTRWFTTEYSMWFDLFLPGLDSVDAPIPLGGTSNHFVTEQLIELGGWDPYNVTEDADLGIRLTREGYRTTIVDSTTYEEANSELSNWIRQRSRWVKGYIQTWLVYMRHPLQLLRRLGWRRFWSFQFVVGGTFISFLLNPIYWVLTTLWVFTQAGVIREIFPGLLFYVAAAALYIGNFVFVYVNAAGAMWRGYDQLVKYALFTPVYWGFMSIAAWKALIQLFTKPHYWEKTEHGLTEQRPQDIAPGPDPPERSEMVPWR